MSKATITGAAFLGTLILLVLALTVRHSARERAAEPVEASAAGEALPSAAAESAPHEHSGHLYGRITVDGATHQGRLRWGVDQEAFWGDFFNGARSENPWAAYTPQGQSKEASRIEIFGFEIGGSRSNELDRLFMARFGDVARIDVHFAHVEVTLKSGSVVSLDRFEAGDIDDGVRVWDDKGGVADIDTRRIRKIEFLPTPRLARAPARLHGVVRTRQGDFSGFVQWNQQDGAGTDTLDGRSDDGETSVRYDTIRSVARHSRDSAAVTLLDGRVIVLSDSAEVGRRSRGVYVDDPRYGRVLILWDAFERIELGGGGGSGPAYGDFPPGRRLAGSVTTRDGRRLAGRLVYDLDESETTETLDVSFEGVDYAIPFGLIATIVPPGREGRAAERGSVTLHGGEEVTLERSGDVSERNGGMLIFAAGRERPEYVPWTSIERIDFDRPPAMYPPLRER